MFKRLAVNETDARSKQGKRALQGGIPAAKTAPKIPDNFHTGTYHGFFKPINKRIEYLNLFIV